MRWILGLAMIGLLLPMQGFSKSPEEVGTSRKAVVVEFVTSMGNIRVQTLPTKAPKTVANFLKYVRDGFYNDTVFHRVIPRFMVQGGGMGPDMVRKKTRSPIPNEAHRSISNQRGTLAMARTGAPHSATAQFFINTVANRFLDHRSKTPRGWGYCVFAKVIEGMDIVDKISKVSTTTRNGHRNVPVEPVWLKRAYVVK